MARLGFARHLAINFSYTELDQQTGGTGPCPILKSSKQKLTIDKAASSIISWQPGRLMHILSSFCHLSSSFSFEDSPDYSVNQYPRCQYDLCTCAKVWMKMKRRKSHKSDRVSASHTTSSDSKSNANKLRAIDYLLIKSVWNFTIISNSFMQAAICYRPVSYVF